MLNTAKAFALFLLFYVTAAYGQTPDVILVDGKIFTGNRAQPYADALAISGSRITAVGSNPEIRRLAGRETRRIHLDGRTVVPGFNDAHTHFSVEPKAAKLEFRSMEPTWAEVSDALRAAVKKTPAGQWIIGQVGGTAYLDRELNRASLDRITRDHRVVIETFYGHGTVVNTAAMKMLGIAERPTDPLGGRYERDPVTGRFNGRANEYANWVLDRTLADFVTDADALTDLKRMGAEAAAFGVTTLQVMPMMRIERFVRLVEQADLPVRVRAIPFSLTTVRARDMT